MFKFVKCSTYDVSLKRYLDLFSVCFPGSEKYSIEYLTWLYRDNPSGQVEGYDAFCNGELAAHYACIPCECYLDGKVVSALLSLNTATHPTYQGKGLFTQLAERTFQSATDDGYCCVYGVANANSTPGFIRKLNFQLVSPLDAKLGFGPLRIDSLGAMRLAQFRRVWDAQAIKWRCSNPANRIIAKYNDSEVTLYAKTGIPSVRTIAKLPIEGEIGIKEVTIDSEKGLSLVNVFLGLKPKDSGIYGMYMDIPNVFKPSPLHLIYRPLSVSLQKLDRDSISLSFFDFDAY